MRKLSLRQKVELKLFGKTCIGYKTKPGWSGYLPFYLVKCEKHGLFETYPEGYREKLVCPKCRVEDET